MRGEGGAAFHFERGAFSTAGWLALNRQYYLLTLARGVGRWLTKPDANSNRICLYAALLYVNFNSVLFNYNQSYITLNIRTRVN